MNLPHPALRPAAAAALLAAAFLPGPARAGSYRVAPDVGNSTATAVFDAKLGERITAQTSQVACDLAYDRKTGIASGSCSVPLTSIVVDNEPTKTEHFQQWATNRKSDASACRIEARFAGLTVGALAPEIPAPFEAPVSFAVCGRGRDGGGGETLRGTAVLFPAGAYGSAETIRIRGTIQGFRRDAYRVGPQFTEGWLARVQSLAKVVAEEGTIELALFARATGDGGVATQR